MAVVVKLQDSAPQGGAVHGADAKTVARRPAAIFLLVVSHNLEGRRPVSGPVFPAVIVQGLGVVVVNEFVAPEFEAAQSNFLLAVLEPFFGRLAPPASNFKASESCRRFSQPVAVAP